MSRHSNHAAWWVAFGLVVALGIWVIVVTESGREPPPPRGVDPSELSTGPERPPARPGDATVVIRVTSDVPMRVSCLEVPTAVRPKDRTLCVEGTTVLKRRLRVDGPLVVASANGVLSALGGRVHCRIAVDGDVRHSARAEGPHRGAYCTAVARVS